MRHEPPLCLRTCHIYLRLALPPFGGGRGNSSYTRGTNFDRRTSRIAIPLLRLCVVSATDTSLQQQFYTVYTLRKTPRPQSRILYRRERQCGVGTCVGIYSSESASNQHRARLLAFVYRHDLQYMYSSKYLLNGSSCAGPTGAALHWAAL